MGGPVKGKQTIGSIESLFVAFGEVQLSSVQFQGFTNKEMFQRVLDGNRDRSQLVMGKESRQCDLLSALPI